MLAVLLKVMTEGHEKHYMGLFWFTEEFRWKTA